MNIWTHLAAYSLIETQRLYLRPFLFEDAEDFYKIASNPDNLQFIFPAQASIEESQYALANYFMKSPLGIWAICDKKEQRMIGAIKFEKLDEIKKEAESDGTVYLLVAHNGISRIIESYFRDMTNEEFAAFGIKYCELRKYEF